MGNECKERKTSAGNDARTTFCTGPQGDKGRTSISELGGNSERRKGAADTERTELSVGRRRKKERDLYVTQVLKKTAD